MIDADSDPDLDRLARRLDSAAAAYYRDTGPATDLAFHAAKSALLAAVALLPGRRWWRQSTCYEWTRAGLLVWAEPGRAPLPARRRSGRPHLVSGPGIVPRAGKSLYPVRSRRERRIPA